jgi:colanic acid biosynthesis glycosyl transferase WcaI
LNTSTSTYRWIVANQSESPAFERMMDRLSKVLGPGLLLTGMPHSAGTGTLQLMRAPAYDRRGLGPRARSWAKFSVFTLARLCRVRGRPFLLAVTNPPSMPVIALLLHSLRGLPYGLLVWDIYPDHIVKMGWLRAGNPLVKAWRAMSRAALRRAAVVMTLSDRMAESLADQVRPARLEPRLRVTPMWEEIDVVGPVPKARNDFAVRHGQAGKITVLYSGNMGASHGLMPAVEAADRLQHDNRIAFLLIGDGLGRPGLERYVADRRLKNVLILDPQDYETLPFSLATGDIALVVQAPGTEHLSLPSKTYSSLAAGSAVVALTSEDSELAALVRTYDAGAVCPWDDAGRLADIIRGLADRPRELARFRTNARAAAVEEFSADKACSRFLSALEPLFRSPASASRPTPGLLKNEPKK